MRDQLSQNIHMFYQVRHIIVHNAGHIDRRFLANLGAAQMMSEYKEGEIIKLEKIQYEDCKRCFKEFFESVEESIISSNLDYCSEI